MHPISVKKSPEGWPINAITHGAPQHADEIIATVMLSAIEPLTVLCTRDRALVANLEQHHVGGQRLYVYDIGGNYDPDGKGIPGVLRFDHHQLDAPKREDGIKYSAAGQIWRNLWPIIIPATLDGCGYTTSLTDEQYFKVYDLIDREFVYEVDAFDNGQLLTPGEGMTMSAILPLFNTCWNEGGDPDMGFIQACNLFQPMFERMVVNAAARVLGKDTIEAAIEESDGAILRLPVQIDGWVDAVLESHNSKAEKLLYVVFFRPADRCWCAQAIPPHDDRWGQRKKFPAAWRGISGQSLAEITGHADAVFCHAEGFFLVAKSEETILELANTAAIWNGAPDR